MNIEFIAETPLEIGHYSPVVEELNRHGHESRIVLMQQFSADPDVQQDYDKDYRQSLCLLEAGSVPFSGDLDDTADVAIVTSTASTLSDYSKRTVRLKYRYGMSTIKRNVHYESMALRGFDGLLVHGEMDRVIFSQYFDSEWIAPIGFPLYDSFFQHPPDPQKLKSDFGISSGKRVITYLPTWNWEGHSSIMPFFSALKELSDSFFIVIKPHPNTELYISERDAYSALRTISPEHLLPSSVALADAVAVADLVLADAKSGAVSEVPLAYPDKPIVMLTPFSAETFWKEINMIGPLVNDPAKLARLVEVMLGCDHFLDSRKKYATLAFGERRGDAAVQAVDSILALCAKARNSSALQRWWRRCGAFSFRSRQ